MGIIRKERTSSNPLAQFGAVVHPYQPRLSCEV